MINDVKTSTQIKIIGAFSLSSHGEYHYGK
jgi:hypothetical protein